jgi:hypothetical protein
MSHAPNTADIAAQLLSLEQALLDPAFRRDRASVAELLAEDFVEFGSSGQRWTRAEILDLLATEQYIPPVIENFECHPITANMVLVTYSTVRIDAHSGARAVVLRSSMWTNLSGVWRVRFHQGTPAK